MPWQPLPSSSGGEPQSLSESVDRLVRSLGAPSAKLTRSVFADWDDIVGPAISPHARPHALRERTLVVAVADPAWATQLRFLEGELLERISAATGSDEIRAIEVRVRRAGTARSS
jgi:predicted nucleic acid-binding Zn ribbon protein